ncbi:MAG TPA: hypothetical protein VMT03_04160 [Polyangia bacterium]|nr:hypothetical protein [Polyangia bacterium]
MSDAFTAPALGLRPGQLPFFRFPYGAKTVAEQTFVQRRGNTTFFWNMDSNDWRIRDPHKLFVDVLAELSARHLETVVFVAAPPQRETPAPWER